MANQDSTVDDIVAKSPWHGALEKCFAAFEMLVAPFILFAFCVAVIHCIFVVMETNHAHSCHP